jgi:hypothetical protein
MKIDTKIDTEQNQSRLAENRLSVPTNPARALRELNRTALPVPVAPVAEEDEDEQNYTTILQTDKPTNRPTDQQTSNQTHQPTNKLANKPTNKPANKQAVKPSNQPPASVNPEPAAPEPAARLPRVDGRTMRVRQETADKTMVTSLRLAVPTVEALDDYCWRHRQRKQDVVQAALDLYFAAMGESEE